MKRKFILGLLIVVCFMILAITPVWGYGFNVGVTPSKTFTTAGDTFTVTLSMDNLDAGSNGVRAFMANLVYDTDAFEAITADDIEGLNDWDVNYNAGNLLLQRSEYTNQDGDICKITFHVKNVDSTVTSGNIEIKNACISANSTKVTTEDQTITMQIKSFALTNENYKIEGNYIKGISPDTQVTTFQSSVIGSGVVIKDKNGNTVTTGKIATGMTLTSGSETYTLIVKGDLNGDGEIDISDVALMKMHMIQLSVINDYRLEAADVNMDGQKADVTDYSDILDVLFRLKTI